MKNYLKAIFMVLITGYPFALSAQRAIVNPPQGDNICLFSSLDLHHVTFFQYTGSEGITGARADQTTFGGDILLKDTLYTSGVGVHAPSKAVVDIHGATRFVAHLAIDDVAANKPEHGIVDYVITVLKDKKESVLKRGTIRRTDMASTKIDVEIGGYDYLVLDLQQGKNNWADQVSWGNAYFEYSGEKPVTVSEAFMYNSKVVQLPAKGKDGGEIVPLSSLEIGKATCGWGAIQENKSIDGNPITLCDTIYASGVGTHAASQMIVKLNGAVTRFVTRVGLDDEVRAAALKDKNNAVVDFRVSLKGEDGNVVVQKEGILRGTDLVTPLIDVDCNGWKYLILEIFEGEGGNVYDHVDWANAYFEYHEQNSTRPAIVTAEEISSKLACATTLFSQPNVRFMHKLRAANPSAEVSVGVLPEGLSWNEQRQLVEGVIAQEGQYSYEVYVKVDGKIQKEVVNLTVSSDLQQPVPMMGWLSWNVVEGEISERVVRSMADAFVEKGILDAGYNYLVIDDLWHADQRETGTGKPLPDARKFPNGMKVVSDYVHSKGLKFGIYSDAAEKTCAGRYGSYGYETIDADQYAKWEVDLLKYDYCFAPSDQESAKKRYKAMGDALKNSGRDILFYMCEWGAREPWLWGHETGATCWRCTLDTRDGWNGNNGGIGMLQSIVGMKDLWAYSGPNRYNDADMMCVGIHGKGKSSSDLVDKPGMTQTEYRTQFALWCMWSSPLTLSFDLRQPISDDDLSIITHEELIAINQDRMGQQAELISESNKMVVFAKDLENGDVAISVTNLNESAKDFVFDFEKIPALDVHQSYYVRDVWAKNDLGEQKSKLEVNVPSHGTLVYRLSKKSATGIQSIDDKDVSVTLNKGCLVVRTGKGNLQNKRILVSDLSGRIMASATGCGAEFVLPIKGLREICVVNIVCGGKSHNVKVKL